MLSYDVVKHWRFEDVRHTYAQRDTMLYALGIGMGADPLDPGQLSFVYERNLQAVPTMASTLGMIVGWLRDPRTGVDYTKIVHGEQDVVVHQALPAAATLLAKNRIGSVCDKGEGKGALVQLVRDLYTEDGAMLVATVRQTSFLRAEGGYSRHNGVSDEAPQALPAVPERRPEVEIELPVLPQASLIYRLSGDYNPLHADPDVAAKAGFPRPILHGLCTYGMAAHAVLRAYCSYDARRLKRLAARMTSPVFPGETIRFELWRNGAIAHLRASVDARDVVVLNSVVAEIG